MNGDFVLERPRIDLSRLRWWAGEWDPFWITQHAQIGAFIRENGIRAVDKSVVMSGDQLPVSSRATSARAKAKFVDPRPFPGGLLCPHLHHRQDLFLLTDKQWKDFAGAVLDMVADRLKRAETIGFEQTLALAGAAASIPARPARGK